MTKSATQQGVHKSPDAITEEQQAAVDQARQNTIKSRTGDLNELAEARRADRDAELAAEGIEVPDTSGDNDDGKPTESDQVSYESDNKPADNTDDSQKVDENTEKFVTLKIDGKEQQVPESKILEAGTRALQKDIAADTRLEEATNILNEAKATAQQIKEGGTSQPSTEDVDDTANQSELDRGALAKTLIDGDVDEVAEAIGKIMGTGRQTELATQAKNMQPNEVYGMVEGALQMKEAMDTFQADPESGGYGDLYSDEKVRQMVFDKEADLVESEPGLSPSERLTKAAEEVRAWRDGLIEQSGGKVVNFGDRSSKKADAKSTPTAASGRPLEQKNEQPKSEADKRREALNKMARSRGQHLD